MNILLIMAALFSSGSILGWTLELFYRRFFSNNNPERKWINPGFCTGPYLPLYGCGLCALYLIARLEKYDPFSNDIANKVLLFTAMAVLMTVIEYIAGLIALKGFKVRLWDYSNEWGNIGGLVCPKFSFFWSLLGALYYFLIHPRVLEGLEWLSQNLAFSFFIGVFFGVFTVDLVHSAQLITKLKQYAVENNVELKYEELKAHIRLKYEKKKKKYRFFHPFRTERPLAEHIREMLEDIRTRQEK